MAIESSSVEGAVVVGVSRGRIAGKLLVGLVTGLLVLGVGLIGGYVAGKQSSSGAPTVTGKASTRARRQGSMPPTRAARA